MDGHRASPSLVDSLGRPEGVASPRPEGARRPEGGALGLHEGIDDPAAGGCQRWPEQLRLLNATTGELVRGRCRSTNLCSYCAKLAAIETTEMLWLDALEQGSPSLWVLLTTSVPEWDGERWRRAFGQVVKAVKRRWPHFEYACLIEFTTGYGPRSGGRRRPHANVFVRGVPVEDEAELQRVVAAVWCPRMAAAEKQQRVYRVTEDRGGMRGLTRYVGLHFQKESQQPEHGWRGHRFRASWGYFARRRSLLREEARESLRADRLWFKAHAIASQAAGNDSPPIELVEIVVENLEHADARARWELVHVNPVDRATTAANRRRPLADDESQNLDDEQKGLDHEERDGNEETVHADYAPEWTVLEARRCASRVAAHAGGGAAGRPATREGPAAGGSCPGVLLQDVQAYEYVQDEQDDASGSVDDLQSHARGGHDRPQALPALGGLHELPDLRFFGGAYVGPE